MSGPALPQGQGAELFEVCSAGMMRCQWITEVVLEDHGYLWAQGTYSTWVGVREGHAWGAQDWVFPSPTHL